MGTHPIFESDFDCLTDGMSDWSSSCNDKSQQGTFTGSGGLYSDPAKELVERAYDRFAFDENTALKHSGLLSAITGLRHNVTMENYLVKMRQLYTEACERDLQTLSIASMLPNMSKESFDDRQ